MIETNVLFSEPAHNQDVWLKKKKKRTVEKMTYIYFWFLDFWLSVIIVFIILGIPDQW